MRRIAMVLGAAAVVAACGDDSAPAKRPVTCTLPDCDAVQALGAMGVPLQAVGTDAWLTWQADAEGVGTLRYHDLLGEPRLVAEGVPAESVAVDPAGASLLFLQPKDSTRSERIGELHRWTARDGDRLLLNDARADQFGACGDWLWSWHGVGAAGNCGWMSALQVSTGRWFDLGDSCDFWSVGRLAQFSRDCSTLATGPGLESPGVGVHRLGGASQQVPAGTGRFVAAPDLGRVAVSRADAPAVLVDVATGEETPLADGAGAYPFRFSASGRSLAYEVDGVGLLLWTQAAAPVELAAGFHRVEAVGFSRDDRYTAWIALGFDGKRTLGLYDADTGRVHTMDGDAFSANESAFLAAEPSELRFSASGRQLLAARHVGAGLELVLWDVAAGEATRLGTLAASSGLPLVDDAGRFATWQDDTGALQLARLADGTVWQVAAQADGARFVGDRLVYARGGKGFAAPLP